MDRYDCAPMKKTHSSAFSFNTRLGGVPVSVAIPPMLAPYATHSAKPLAIVFISWSMSMVPPLSGSPLVTLFTLYERLLLKDA